MLSTSKKVKTHIDTKFSKVEAIALFEKNFEKYTENRWVEKEFFQAKPGKYQIMSDEVEKEKLDLAMNQENEIRGLLKQAFNQNKDEFLKFVWNLDMAKKAMKDMSLDTTKLPLGCLKIERVKKLLQILGKIQKQLQQGGTLTTAVENKISELTQQYYAVLPYDFGAKKPPGIDHIIRVKDKVKQMDLLGDIFLME